MPTASNAPRHPRAALGVAGFCFAAALLLTSPAAAQSSAAGPVRAAGHPDMLRTKHELIFREAHAEAAERREATAKLRKLGRKRALVRLAGKRTGPVPPGVEESDAPVPVAARAAQPASVSGVNTAPTNLQVNNKSGDNAGDTQAECGMALLGTYGMCAWNNGHNFSSTVDAQTVGYTTNGGVSWTDAGAPPKPAGARWASDPVVTVNEKTGTFYYFGLIDFPLAGTNGVTLVPATFPGGVLTWGTPVTIRNAPNSVIFFDKEWMVADSSNGNLYVTYVTFDGGFTTDSIQVQRSTDNGATWGDPITMNTVAASFGNVQGPRVVVGPAGEVYAGWYEIGPVDADFVKVRKSTNGGASFGSEATAASYYTNFGTGSPGFNRDHGVNFPSLAVDRSTGPHRGRVYAAYNETVNWYDDLLGTGGNQAEVESNGTTATANAFVIGKNLTAAISPSNDVDFFSFTATQGTNYIFWCQPASGLKYTMGIRCTDGVTKLGYSGSTSGPGANGFIVWTAPASGTYYLRVAGLSSGGTTGTYTVHTGVDAPSSGDHARDMRDALVSHSDDGVFWSAGVRANDDLPRFDNYLSEMTVSCEGYPYVSWFDYRDSPAGNCGGVANLYTSRSTDGGATYATNQIVTTASSNYSTAASNLQPNMGDYNGMYGGANVGYGWADARLGDPDIFSAHLLAVPAIGCPTGPTVNSGDTFVLNFSMQNLNVMFGNTYAVTLASEHPWSVTPANQNFTLASNASTPFSFTVTAPDTFPSGTNNLTLQVTAQNGGLCATCVVRVTVVGVPSGVPPGGGRLALAGAWPNPASSRGGLSIAFSLGGSQPAKLELLDLGGRRVLEREVGSLGAGSHVLSWSREASGLPAGVYVVRLSQSGRALTSKLILTR